MVLNEVLVVEVVAIEAMGLELPLGEVRDEAPIGTREVAGRAI